MKVHKCDRLSPTTALTSTSLALFSGNTLTLRNGDTPLTLAFSDYRYDGYLNGQVWCDNKYTTTYSISGEQSWMTFDSSPREPTLEITSIPAD